MSTNELTTQHKPDLLFPEPSLPPSPLSPQRLPGANLESLSALQEVLKDNHKQHHIFFNYTRFHNHITHRALAIYALGGSASLIRDYYKRDGGNQRRAFESPEPITEQNFVEHLGDENYYQAYAAFFSKQLFELGAAKTLEKFVFSEEYNFQKGRDASTQPEMLNRLMEGVIHPMIHIGYGAEFGMMGMLAEGLALAAVHDVHHGFIPQSIFVTSTVDQITNNLPSLILDPPLVPSTKISKTRGVHAFDVLARMLKDDGLKRKVARDIVRQFADTLAEHASAIWRYAEQWTIDGNQPGEIEKKMEELIWLSSVVHGVGGFESDGFKSDFFLMHLVTSSLFLPSLIAYLSPRSQALLLRAYLATVLMVWVARGCPRLNIKSFMTSAPPEPSVPTTPTPQTATTTETTVTPNPFLPILQSAITHPQDHVVKIQRAFAHFDTLYGRRPAGYFKGTELEGAELLDGSVFLRNALLTADYVGWVREGKELRMFDFDGFYH